MRIIYFTNIAGNFAWSGAEATSSTPAQRPLPLHLKHLKVNHLRVQLLPPPCSCLFLLLLECCLHKPHYFHLRYGSLPLPKCLVRYIMSLSSILLFEKQNVKYKYHANKALHFECIVIRRRICTHKQITNDILLLKINVPGSFFLTHFNCFLFDVTKIEWNGVFF